MNVIKKTIKMPCSRNTTYHLFFLGDTHNGNICFDENKFKQNIEKIRSIHNAIVFGMGDYNDCINYLDPRLILKP